MKNFNDLIKKVDEDLIILDVTAEDLYYELKGLKGDLEDLLESLISSFENRVRSVRQELMDIHSKLPDRCKMSQMSKEFEPWDQIFLLLGSHMDNLFSNKEQVCS